MGSGSAEAVERPARIEALKRMFQRYADQPDSKRLELYVQDTWDLPLEVLERAIAACVRVHRGSFAPGIGDLWSHGRTLLPAFEDAQERRAYEGIRDRVGSVALETLIEHLDALTGHSGLHGHWQGLTITLLSREIARRERKETPE